MGEIFNFETEFSVECSSISNFDDSLMIRDV